MLSPFDGDLPTHPTRQLPRRPTFSRRRLLGVLFVTLSAGAACAPAASPAPAGPTTAKPAASPVPPTAAPPQPTAAAKVAPTQAATAQPTAPAKAPATVAAVVPFRLGSPSRSFGYVYTEIGNKLGIFKKAGVELDLKPLQSDVVALQALIAGEVDVINVNPSASLASIEKGAPLKIVGVNWVRTNFAMYAEKSITGLKDLPGKAISISGENALPHNLIRVAMLKEGLDPSKVEWVATGNPGQIPSLLAGKVQATAAVGDFIPMVTANPDYRLLFEFATVLPGVISGAFITSEGMIASKPNVILSGLIGATEALRWQADPKNLERVIEIAQAFSGIDANQAKFSQDWYFSKMKLADLNCFVPPQSLQFTQEANVMLGTQQAVLSIDKVNSYQFQKQVVERLGSV